MKLAFKKGVLDIQTTAFMVRLRYIMHPASFVGSLKELNNLTTLRTCYEIVWYKNNFNIARTIVNISNRS